MPAPLSSPIDPAIGHLVELAAETAERQPGLLAVLARVADPRHRRGVRHRLTVILGLALCAVVAGARSFTAIAEWAADADELTGAWAQRRTAPGPRERRVIAVDGKTLRGSASGGQAGAGSGVDDRAGPFHMAALSNHPDVAGIASRFKAHLQGLGYDSVIYRNEIERGRGRSAVVFDPGPDKAGG